MTRYFPALLSVLPLSLCFLLAPPASATPDFVTHNATAAVYGESAGTTMRQPNVPREDEVIDLWVKIGYSFYYSDVAVYYTIDGSDPQGSKGIPGNGSTFALRSSMGQVNFVRNEPHSPNNIDWWKATLPVTTRTYNNTVKYKIGAWNASGGFEVFANNSGCADGTCDNPAAPAAVFSYTVKLAWPGKGSPNPSPGAGYPNIHFWKEEAVVGNNWMNVQLDQNGSIYDIYYPSVGCVQGVATKNEGYVDGLDTFPPGLPLGNRGQMHMNMGTAGIRVDGVTYWLTNEGGAYSTVTQTYLPDTNITHESQILTGAGNNIRVDQYDFCPRGVTYPNDTGGTPVRGIFIKRFILTNNGASDKAVNFYYFADYEINGGNAFDAMFTDPLRGAMVVYDNTFRNTSSNGEYNPTFFSDYTKDVSVYLASSLKLCSAVGGISGTTAGDFWRDSSTDNDQGWMGLKVTLNAGQSKEVDLAIVGGFDNFAPDGGTTYNAQVVPALNWFLSSSAADLQAATQNYWTSWLVSGTTIDFPDNQYDVLFKRSLLATALHIDEKGGGIVAGMHNGAYPYVWPRDAVYAAITLDKTGHFTQAENVYRFLREVAYRAQEEPGRKGYWYQKYTTNGYQVWTAPQVDETASIPWGIKYHYDAVGQNAFLDQNYQMIYEAARSSSENSNLTSQLYLDTINNLMHSNNVWEDSYDDFLYSNASVERGLRDAAIIATSTGHTSDALLFTSRANQIHTGILGRLAWDGENTDISQLGISYPYESLPPNDSRMQHIIDRINGSATDCYGNNHPILVSGGEFNGLVNRYWGDNYWNGGPWFLSTLWYGQFYAKRQEFNPGKADIDVLKTKIDLLIGRLGPAGLGAEQIAPLNSLLFPGQTDFSLQAAWPNAWESMSTLVDSLMLFLDYRPDAVNHRCFLAPKLPTGWDTFTFHNLHVGADAFDITASEFPNESRQTFINRTPGPVSYDTTIRIPAGRTVLSVTKDGVAQPYTYNAATGQVHLAGTLSTGTGVTTTLKVLFCDGCVAVPLMDVLLLPQGTGVAVSGVVVTRVHTDRFNIEPANRAGGLAVIGSGAVRGKTVTLLGTVGYSGAEVILNLTSILEQVDAPTTPEPLVMSNKTAGGAGYGNQHGVTGSVGPNNIGLDVTLFGVVKHIQGDLSYMTIDDGSGLTGRYGEAGVRVVGNLGAARFQEGDFVIAVGSMSIEQSNGIYHPLLRVANLSDIR